MRACNQWIDCRIRYFLFNLKSKIYKNYYALKWNPLLTIANSEQWTVSLIIWCGDEREIGFAHEYIEMEVQLSVNFTVFSSSFAKPIVLIDIWNALFYFFVWINEWNDSDFIEYVSCCGEARIFSIEVKLKFPDYN